jgi:hypothetical protein
MSNKPIVWFGQMEFGVLKVGEGNHASEDPVCIVHRIDERRNMDTADIEEYITKQNHEGDYVVPSEFGGDIVFSMTYMKGHTR